MPFGGQIYFFNQWVIATANEVGAVYGLFKPSLRAGYVDCLYVGKTDNLRRRLAEHLNNPPVAGITTGSPKFTQLNYSVPSEKRN